MEISSLNVLVGGKTVEVSLKEARELYEKLHDLFGKRETVFANACLCGCRPYWYSQTSLTWCATTNNSGLAASTIAS